MSKNITVLGAGRMGVAVAYAMDKLGCKVSVYDRDRKALTMAKSRIGSITTMTAEADWIDKKGYQIISNADVVISCLPYHQTEKIAKKCTKSNIRYCDLGGRVDVSKAINDFAEGHTGLHNKPVFTDLGLAPGLANILAEWGYNELGGAEKISMMVGGLPVWRSKNPLKYMVTWSVDGLINEYRDDCEILKNGEIQIVKGMDGLETVESRYLGEMEAFYTSGGASHTIHTMKDRGVKECSYKTMRHSGHCEIVKFLIRDCKLSDDCLKEIFEKGCCEYNNDDLVLVRVEVEFEGDTWKKEIIVYADIEFSAMQKATAFSISAVAGIMSEGILDGRSSLAYKDIPFDLFKSNLEKLGVAI